jgi:hypothetical protein
MGAAQRCDVVTGIWSKRRTQRDAEAVLLPANNYWRQIIFNNFPNASNLSAVCSAGQSRQGLGSAVGYPRRPGCHESNRLLPGHAFGRVRLAAASNAASRLAGTTEVLYSILLTSGALHVQRRVPLPLPSFAQPGSALGSSRLGLVLDPAGLGRRSPDVYRFP